MEKKRVLYISQEISPFLPKSDISKAARKLPQGIQEAGKEIRAFMPRYGCINERRHQLHEVIRLSGMNLIINDVDHPLIIKVASVPQAKIQVYFIDNEDFFTRKATVKDEDGEYFEDNDERAMFFGRGVLETVKKLGWKPDIIHCHGWMTALTPLYIKKLYNNDPHFADAKVVYSVYDNSFNKNWDPKFNEKLKFDGFNEADVADLENLDWVTLNKKAIEVSDGVIQGSENMDASISEYIEKSEIPFLEYYSEETCVKPVNEFYDQIFEEIVV
ncbi:glycogen/starch synthase [Crocinitomix catalasitica]|uniref:glycogen/starch synthase n=1 Tax=Crocinitomix catalasitica TaxID=184607 RepID=UPI00048A348D|nr:glycogen/starch synthase [Crocinitomix catalasitica]